MAVDRVAGRTGVLPSHAAGLRALLQEAGLIDDQDAARVVPEVVDDVAAQIIADGVGIPGGGVQEALDTLRSQLADRLRELPAVLALDAAEQADEIAPGALAYFRPGEATRDPPMQRLQGLRPSRDGARFNTGLLRDHAALLSCGEQRSAVHREVSL